MKPIAEEINKLIKKIFARQHYLLPEIVINWPKIVGLKFSRQTSPLKISTIKEKGTSINVLYVEVSSSSLSLEIEFQQEIIMERIAVYLGFKAIHKLRPIVISTIK